MIRNPITGQDIRFLQTSADTGGKLLDMESTYRSYSKGPPPHFHPYQEEHITVISGEMTARIDGGLHILKAGGFSLLLLIYPDTGLLNKKHLD